MPPPRAQRGGQSRAQAPPLLPRGARAGRLGARGEASPAPSGLPRAAGPIIGSDREPP